MKNFELFIVDNVSTDRIPDIAQTYLRKDLRIKHFGQKEWVCATENWSSTYELAAPGVTFFRWASDDDLWAKDYIESLLPPLIQNPNMVLSFSQVDEIDMQGQKVGELYRKFFPGGSTAFKRNSIHY